MATTHPMGPGASGVHAFGTAPGFLHPLMLAGAPALHHALVMHGRMLEELDEHTRRWFERRHTAAARALDATVALVEARGGDPLQAMRIASGVLDGVIGTLAADARDGAHLCGRCLGLVTDRGPATGADMLPRAVPAIVEPGHQAIRPRQGGGVTGTACWNRACEKEKPEGRRDEEPAADHA